MQLPDYSEWLTPERLAIEERLWEECGYYKWYAAAVQEVLPPNGSVCELGAGTAWIPTVLPNFGLYTCVDRNPQCMALGEAKHAGSGKLVIYRLTDVRDLWHGLMELEEDEYERHDVSCAFAFLKHFPLHEIQDVLDTLVMLGKRSVFTIPPAEKEDFDDGVEFPHIHLTTKSIHALVHGTGSRITEQRMLPNEEWLVFTEPR